jgi:hypothetical protein
MCYIVPCSPGSRESVPSPEIQPHGPKQHRCPVACHRHEFNFKLLFHNWFHSPGTVASCASMYHDLQLVGKLCQGSRSSHLAQSSTEALLRVTGTNLTLNYCYSMHSILLGHWHDVLACTMLSRQWGSCAKARDPVIWPKAAQMPCCLSLA